MSEDTFAIVVAVLLLIAASLIAAPVMIRRRASGLPTVLAVRSTAGELIALGDIWEWRDGGEPLVVAEIVGVNVLLEPQSGRGAVFRFHPDDLTRRMRRVAHWTTDGVGFAYPEDDRTAIDPGPPSTIVPPPMPPPSREEDAA